MHLDIEEEFNKVWNEIPCSWRMAEQRVVNVTADDLVDTMSE